MPFLSNLSFLFNLCELEQKKALELEALGGASPPQWVIFRNCLYLSNAESHALRQGMAVSLQGIGSLCRKGLCSTTDPYFNIDTLPDCQHYPDYLHTYYVYI